MSKRMQVEGLKCGKLNIIIPAYLAKLKKVVCEKKQ
jgi:hypothetical protein